MDTEHTPLPWTADTALIFCATGIPVARICVGSREEDNAVRDRAALIVHSVNLLPELVEALREARVEAKLLSELSQPETASGSHWTTKSRSEAAFAIIDNLKKRANGRLATIDALLAKATS